MAFLDRFNDWYVRSIPETTPGNSVAWREPVAGARYRWKKSFSTRLAWLMVIFLLILMVPSKHKSGQSFESRLWMALIITAGYGSLAWICRNSSLNIVLTTRYVVVGAGSRGAKHIRLDTAHTVILEDLDGHQVLVVRETSDDLERIYLGRNEENAVKELLTNAGLLKNPQPRGGGRELPSP
jgi:hypothetical protein